MREGEPNEPALVGRLDVLDTLRRRLDAVRAGRGGLTILEGDVGTGKSTLIRSLASEWGRQGNHVLVGRSPSTDNPPPFSLIRAALGVGSPTVETPPLLSGPGGMVFAPPAPADLVMIGFVPRVEIRAAEPGPPLEERVLDSLGGPEETSESGRNQLIGQLTDDLLHQARRQPTVLILEDLHTADEPSIEFLERLAPQAESATLWVLATALPLANVPGPRRAILERLEREAHGERVVIRPFTINEVSEFARTIDPSRTVDPEEVTRWHSQSGGNPLFLEQLIRLPKGGGAPMGRHPEAVVRTVAELPHEQQRIMGVASVLGREFPFSVLLKASGEDEERLTEITDALVQRALLRERPDETLEFVRDDWRNEVYRSLTDTRRRLLHRRAGEAIESGCERRAASR